MSLKTQESQYLVDKGVLKGQKVATSVQKAGFKSEFLKEKNLIEVDGKKVLELLKGKNLRPSPR